MLEDWTQSVCSRVRMPKLTHWAALIRLSACICWSWAFLMAGFILFLACVCVCVCVCCRVEMPTLLWKLRAVWHLLQKSLTSSEALLWTWTSRTCRLRAWWGGETHADVTVPATHLNTHTVHYWTNLFKKEVSSVHQGCIYLIKNTVKLWNIITI